MCNFNEILSTSFYKLKIKHQVFLGIISIIIINLLLITIIITLNVFMLSNSAYKDVINTLDNQEFDQLAYFTMASEYANMHMSGLINSFVSIIASIKINLESKGNLGLLDSSYIDSQYPDFILHLDEFNSKLADNSITNLQDKIIYFSPSKSFEKLKSDVSFLNQIKIIKSLIPVIKYSFYVNLFNQKLSSIGKSNDTFFNNLIFVNYDHDVIFYFPGNKANINKDINLSELKDYVKNKNIEKAKIIELFSGIGVNPPKSISSTVKYLSNAPLYLEDDIYPNFYSPNSNVNLKTLSSINLYTNPSSSLTIDNYLDVFDQSIFLVSAKSSADLIYDFLSYQVPATNVFKVDFLYPYKLYTSFQCDFLVFTRDYSQPGNFTNKFSDCFNTEIRHDNTYYSDKSDLDEVFDNLYLFNDYNVTVTNSIKESIIRKELDIFKNKLSAHSSTVNRRVVINGMNYKIRKTYSPLSSYSFFKFMYPISYLYMTVAIKNEGLFDNNKRYFFMRSIGNFIFSFFGSLIICYAILIFIIYYLVQVMALIDKPLNIINYAVQTISEKDKFNEAKFALEKYIYDTSNDQVIDEFVDLITIILDMFEGNMNLKQETTQLNDIRLKMEEDSLYKEFELVKMNNLIVLEDRITDLVEKKNYFNDILKINIEKEIITDEKVRSSKSFMRVYENYVRNYNINELNKLRTNGVEIYEDRMKLKFGQIPFSKKTTRVFSIQRITLVTSKLDNAQNSSDYDSQEEDNIFEIDEVIRKKVRKLYTVRNSFMLGKLRKTENPLFYAYEKMKNMVFNDYANKKDFDF
jgi:hypothetical protein